MDRRELTARSVARRIGTRVAAAALVLIGAATVAFIALHTLPGDPVATILGGHQAAPGTVRELRRELGVGQSLPHQYLSYMGRLLRGDLGRSYQLDAPVTRVIGEQLWSTVSLALVATALGFAGAIPVALATTGPRRRLRRTAVGTLELVAISTPTFWLGILLLTLFSFQLHVFPVVSDQGGIGTLVLPAVTLALPLGAVLAQVLRDGLDEALRQPFALTARAHGLADGAVLRRHALRHALLPVVTLSGWAVGTLLSGAVLVETVFGRPGVGQIAARAVTSGDLPVVIGVVLLSAFAFVVLNTLVDLLYLVIDPRLRTPGRGAA